MAEIGMKLLRALEPGVAEAPSEKSPGKTRDPADAFASLSRAVRLTLALEAKTDEQLRQLKAGVVRKREADEAQAAERAQKTREAREKRVHELVMDAVMAESESDQEFGEFSDALDERLDADEAYFDMADRPLRETVERLCKDLCLSPDWSHWDGEGWTQDFLPARARYSLFHTASPRPLLNDDGSPRETPPSPTSLQNGHDLE
jgi:hypothetical protein